MLPHVLVKTVGLVFHLLWKSGFSGEMCCQSWHAGEQRSGETRFFEGVPSSVLLLWRHKNYRESPPPNFVAFCYPQSSNESRTKVLNFQRSYLETTSKGRVLYRILLVKNDTSGHGGLGGFDRKKEELGVRAPELQSELCHQLPCDLGLGVRSLGHSFLTC